MSDILIETYVHQLGIPISIEVQYTKSSRTLRISEDFFYINNNLEEIVEKWIKENL